MAMILGRRHVLDLVDLPRATNRFSWASPGNPCFRLRTHVSWISVVRKSWVSCVGFLGFNPGFEARILEKSQFLRFFWDSVVLRLHARLLASLVGLTRLLDQLLTKHLAADSTSNLG